MGSLVVLLLAERARSECARPTRAFEDQPGHPLKSVTSERGRGEGMVRCPCCSQSPLDKKDWKDTHVGPVLPERAP